MMQNSLPFLIGMFVLIYLAGLHFPSMHYKAYIVIEVGKIAFFLMLTTNWWQIHALKLLLVTSPFMVLFI